MIQITPLFVPGAPGGPELLIILFIAVLLFGANKIPKLARSTGEAMGEFRKGQEKAEQELEEMRKIGTGDVDAGERKDGANAADARSASDAGKSRTDAQTETAIEQK